MNARIKKRSIASGGLHYHAVLSMLSLCALILIVRLAYFYLSDAERFPITTIKMAATYQHVTHKELENILDKYLMASFFSLSVNCLQNELNAIHWIEKASVERVWPDTLKIKLVEKKPIALWDNALMTEDGRLFYPDVIPPDIQIPRLKGPLGQRMEVLQVYEKLSKILSDYELRAAGLVLRENQSWVLILDNGVKVYLGKNELEMRLLRFCKAYPAVFAQKADQLASVDLRYLRGMAVQWKQQTER